MKGGMMQTVRRKPMAEINVVPYIDVMLVLLVIFMVTAPMLTQGVKVELPETTSDPIQAEKDTESVVVSVDANGAYYLQVGDEGSDPMPLGQVQEMVGKIMAERTNREVLVRGDDNVQYGKVVRLMSVLQQAGATNVGLITEAEDLDDAGG
ncbi:protein TolR [Marinobacter zhanjiangensis]|uniref:Tol-Pal system protein TolR n=1 Tax=Marinobacter zhanjiangensis TaxID=578215 RepID=A0ABQ3B9I0_9GAMM|nr:protein TolR [Marinobacter zhanjiangensis]GGY85216.1 protein TolR [Marinobacter zhanjiangensis]